MFSTTAEDLVPDCGCHIVQELLVLQFFLGTASGTAIRWQWNVRPELLIYYRHLDISYSSVLNYSLFDFFISDLTTCLIQNFVQNITFSIVICFINTNSSKVA